MVDLWSRGGLSWRELLVRTWHETWEDAVFGQAARLAFYHFLALFPSVLLLLFLLTRLHGVGAGLRESLLSTFREVLPQQASALVEVTMNQLNARAGLGIGALSALAGATWAALNGTRALIVGLDTAYEVTERRPLSRIGVLIVSLTLALGCMGLFALGLILFGTHFARIFGQHLSKPYAALLIRIVMWPVIVCLLLFAFSLVYRFGPNLRDRRWQWSTPGALVALILWIGATIGLRFYLEQFHSYDRIYGPMSSVAALLMWLYLTSAAILIGGELNSEIEKAANGTHGHRVNAN